MSMFENDQYRWRETYFVLFESSKRPRLKAVEKKLLSLGGRFTLANGVAAERGLFESVTVLAPDDFAALDICFIGGDEVREQVESLIREMKTPDLDPDERRKLNRLRDFDARFDVLHFEQLTDTASEDEEDMLDPSTLLLVLGALAELTDGIAVDPQAGAML
jgi:hypothetical protein